MSLTRRILLTLDFPPEIGGIQNYLYLLAKHRVFAWDQVVTTAPGDMNCFMDFGETTKVTRIVNRSGHKIEAIVKMVLQLLKDPCRIVYCGNVYAGIAAWIVSRVKPLHYMVFCYGTEIPDSSAGYVKRKIFSAVYKNSSIVIGISAFTLTRLQKLTGPVTYEIVSPKIERELLLQRAPVRRTRSDFTLLYIGRIVKHKGVQSIVQALAHLANVKLIIAGTGPYTAELLEIIKKTGVADKVKLLGTISEVQKKELLSRADLFVLPTLDTSDGVEGFGIVLLEAMAHYLPILCAPTGAISEVVENGKYATLLSSHVPEDIAQDVESIRRGYEKTLQKSYQAYSYVKQRYCYR